MWLQGGAVPLLFKVGLVVDPFPIVPHLSDILPVVDHLSLLLFQRFARFDVLLDMLCGYAVFCPVEVELELRGLYAVAFCDEVCQGF